MVLEDLGVVAAVQGKPHDLLGVAQDCLSEQQLREASLSPFEPFQMQFSFKAIKIRARRAGQTLPAKLLVLMRIDSPDIGQGILLLEIALSIEGCSFYVAD